jgi:hypothetical protein
MTYEEYYMGAKTLKELEGMITDDIATAMLISCDDRVKVIAEAGEKVANLKFGGVKDD